MVRGGCGCLCGSSSALPCGRASDAGRCLCSMYFPTFYVLKYSLVQGEPADLAMGRYWQELWPNCQALWMIWVPAQVRRASPPPPAAGRAVSQTPCLPCLCLWLCWCPEVGCGAALVRAVRR